MRLFRVDLTGAVEGYKFVGVVDFGNSDTEIKDLYVQFDAGPTVRIGNFKTPNGLEWNSSVYSTVFMERASIQKANGLNRRLGVAAYESIGRFNLQGGLFATDVNDENNEDGWAAAGRVTFSDEVGEGVLHLGASARYRQAGDSEGPLGFSQRPVANMAPKTVNSGSISDNDTFVGLEGAFVSGGWSFQSEYGWTAVDCAFGACTDDPTFQTGYVDASYMWGGARNYNAGSGTFKRDRVFAPAGDGGWGAFAVSARYDVTDLDDGLVMGGTQESAILGLTYFRDNYVRFMVNIANSEFDDSPTYGDDDAQSVTARVQIELH